MEHLLMDYQNTCEIIFSYASKRIKKRKEFLKLTNEIIAGKKIFVHYEAYDDPTKEEGEFGHDDSSPEYFKAEKNPTNSKYDVSMISRIMSNNRKGTKNRQSPNPFLVPPTYENLLVEKLQFEDVKELFWGTSAEHEYIVTSFYKVLFEEVLEDGNSELSELLNLYLTDYIPFSRDLAYYQMIVEKCLAQCNELIKTSFSTETEEKGKNLWDIFINMLDNDLEYLLQSFENGNTLTVVMYATIDFIFNMIENRYEDTDVRDLFLKFKFLKENLEYTRREALGRIIFLNYKNLFKLYQSYFFRQKNFKSLNKKISEFTSDILTPFFKELLGEKDEFKVYSLGYRVKNIIETDIESIFVYTSRITPEQYDDFSNQNATFYKKLLKSSTEYVFNLKYIQLLSDKELSEILSYEDVEKFYFQSVDIKDLFFNWEKEYDAYLQDSYLVEYGDYLEEDEYDELIDGTF